MKRFLKWVAYALAGLAGILVLVALGLYLMSSSRISETYDVAAAPITLPTDSASVARGEHLVTIMGCRDCHVENLAGQVFIDQPIFMVLSAPNLTSGRGGALTRYDDAGIVRAIRHGINSDNRSLVIMPSPEYNHLSDEDVGSIVAYLKTLPPADNEMPGPKFGPIGRTLIATGQAEGVLVASLIDHDAPRPPAPEPGPTAEYGAYLGRICTGCHGPTLAGTTEPGPDSSLPAKNLTPAGNLATWDLAAFVTAMRTGVTPSGYELNATSMPWPTIARATDEELAAVFAYLKTLPPAQPE